MFLSCWVVAAPLLHLYIRCFNWRKKRNAMKENTTRSSILVITTGFLAIFLLFSYKWAIYTSLAIGIAGIFSPYLSNKIDRVWMKFSTILGFIIPNILLTIVFYFILFPVSLISKIFRRDPMMLSEKHDSYFINIKKEITGESLKKPW